MTQEELQSQVELFKTVARVLWQDQVWNDLPWGAKQILMTMLTDEEKKNQTFVKR